MECRLLSTHLTHDINVRPVFSPSHVLGKHILICNTFCINAVFHLLVLLSCHFRLQAGFAVLRCSYLSCSTIQHFFPSHICIYIKQALVINPISKNNLWVFTGGFPPLKLMTNSHFVPVLLTSYLFMQGLQWRLTQEDQNYLISFTFMFTDFFKEYLQACGTGFPRVRWQ